MHRNSGVGRNPSVSVPDGFDAAPPRPTAPAAAPPAAQASSSGTPKGWRQQGARLQRQTREANVSEAHECNARLAGYNQKLQALKGASSPLIAKGRADVSACHAAYVRAYQEPDKSVTLTKLADTLLDRAVDNFRKAMESLDARTADGRTIVEVVGADIGKIESAPNRNSMYTLNAYLKDNVDVVKTALVMHQTNTIVATSGLVEAETQRLGHAHDRLAREQDALIVQTAVPSRHVAACSGLVKAQREFDALADKLAHSATRNAELVSRCDALLADPDVKAPEVTKQIKHLRQIILCNLSLNIINGAHLTDRRIRTLMALNLYENAGSAGHEQLKSWATDVLEAGKTLRSVGAVNISVLHDEKDDGTRREPLPPQAMAARLQAAIEGPEQLGNVARAFQKRASEYAGMRGIVADARLKALLSAMPEQLAECIRIRTVASQRATEQLEALQSTPFTVSAYVPPAGTRALQPTREGIVLGCVNPAGGLDGVDEQGNVIASYFKDQDSGTWVRDFGEEAEPAAARGALDKARQITARAGRTGREAQAALAACDDVDERVDILQRAFSRTARELAALAGVLAGLPADGGEADEIKGLMAGLRKDKAALDRQLQQAQEARTIHAHKTRDPNEAGFLHLLKAEQVASIVKNFSRRPSQKEAGDWIDRYTISFKNGPKGEKYKAWVVHAHYTAADAAHPATSHMKRASEKDWGRDRRPYHSPELGPGTLDRIKALARG